MKILTTNIGEKRTIEYKGKSFTTGIVKLPVSQGVVLGDEDVVGDNVIDRKHHGGVDQAVYAFGYNHYTYFENLYPNQEWQKGMFGENLTLDFMDEHHLYVGNQYEVGEAIVEVTKPRNPCSTLGARFQDMSIVKAFWNTENPGTYFKVIKRGRVMPGDVFKLIKECPDNPSIASVFIASR